ncbi:hypothetical protein MTR67_034652 [Solanum verrucosum]|uniref:Uncharacterized protein n=1 Tax=Solanum verrucosum TaxID=315347 RepID=A0AAF0ZJF8_SOLVR|nr:hypothetical protein MTR67_034652 [Solanum verrucosum]
MKLLKLCLKKLDTQYIRNIVTKASEYREELKVVQEKLQTDPLNHYKRRRRSNMKSIGILLILQSFLQQQKQQLALMQDFTSRGVKETMFKIDCNKSPGPDSYGSWFFRSAWEVIGKDITEAILKFFGNGLFPHKVPRATIIFKEIEQNGMPLID